jgi:hypothetical protein
VGNQESEQIKIVTQVDDPPTLTDAEIEQINEEGRRLSQAFAARTASMVRLTADDLRIRLT